MTSEHEEFEEAAKQLSASSHVEHVVNWELERASNFNFYVGPRGFDDQEVATIPSGDLLASEDEEWVRLKVIQPRIRRLSITNISSMMTDFLSACDAAERELAQHRDSDYYRPGEAWDRFVLHLKYFWESLGPAHKATVNKNYDAPPSLFASFVNTVQFQIDPRFRRHDTGSSADLASGALSGAIYKALRAEKGDAKLQPSTKKQSSKRTRLSTPSKRKKP